MSILIRKLTHNFVLPLWNEKAIELIDEYFTPSADIQTTFLIGKGPEAVKQSVSDTFKAFPQFKLTIEDAVEQNETLIYKWRSEVKHEGSILNIPPTGHKMIFCGTVYGKLEENLIQVYHSFSNIPQILYANLSPFCAKIAEQFSDSPSLPNNTDELVWIIEEALGIRLTKREIECLVFWLRGFSIKDTAKILGGLSHKTVQSYRVKIKQKLLVLTYRDLINMVKQAGILPLLLKNL